MRWEYLGDQVWVFNLLSSPYISLIPKKVSNSPMTYSFLVNEMKNRSLNTIKHVGFIIFANLKSRTRLFAYAMGLVWRPRLGIQFIEQSTYFSHAQNSLLNSPMVYTFHINEMKKRSLYIKKHVGFIIFTNPVIKQCAYLFCAGHCLLNSPIAYSTSYKSVRCRRGAYTPRNLLVL